MSNEVLDILSQSFRFAKRDHHAAVDFAIEANMAIIGYDRFNYLAVPVEYLDEMMEAGYDLIFAPVAFY